MIIFIMHLIQIKLNFYYFGYFRGFKDFYDYFVNLIYFWIKNFINLIYHGLLQGRFVEEFIFLFSNPFLFIIINLKIQIFRIRIKITKSIKIYTFTGTISYRTFLIFRKPFSYMFIMSTMFAALTPNYSFININTFTQTNFFICD